MTVKEFKEQMLDVLNLEEEIDLEVKLKDIEEWDSLAYVTFISMATGYTDRKITASEVRGAVTMRDLYNLITKD